MNTNPMLEIVQVTHDTLSELEDLWSADWLEEHANDEQGDGSGRWHL